MRVSIGNKDSGLTRGKTGDNCIGGKLVMDDVLIRSQTSFDKHKKIWAGPDRLAGTSKTTKARLVGNAKVTIKNGEVRKRIKDSPGRFLALLL